MRRFIPFIILLVICGCAPKFLYYEPPLPGVKSALETPGFWIERVSNPDSLLLDEDEIRLLNREIEEKGLYFNVMEEDTVFYEMDFREEMEKSLKRFKSTERVSHSGLPFTAEFWQEAEESMNLHKMPFKIENVYGITVKRIHLRDLPTNEIGVSSSSCEFNRLQVTMLKPFEPIMVIHKTEEKEWLYVKSGLAEGWVRAENIITADRHMISSYLDTPFVVITGADVPLYADLGLEKFLMWLPMGTRIKLNEVLSDDVISVTIPVMGENGGLAYSNAFVENDVYISIGHLPYTQRNAIRQAFRLLSMPYGWGGTWGSDDCSGTILRIFSCFGIYIPRNSRQQLKVGIEQVSFTKKIKDEERRKALKSTIPGITLLGWPGHIMLYLGEYNGHHYCLQNIWAFKKKRWFTEDTHYIGKVVVSDLSLGEGTKRGSILRRLTTARIVLLHNLKGR